MSEADGPIRVREDIIIPIIKWIHFFFPETPVVIERKNRPRPDADYFSINTISPYQQPGLNDSSELLLDSKKNPIPGEKEGHFKYMISGQRVFSLSLKAYIVKNGNCEDTGNSFAAFEMLARLRDAISTDIERELLVQAGLSVFIRNDILDLTDLIESGYEERAGMDLMMGIASNRVIEIPAIAKTVITGTVENEKTQVEIDFES